MAHAAAIVAITLVRGEIGTLRELAKARKLGIVAHGEHDVAVAGLKRLVWHDIRVSIAVSRGIASAGQVVHRLARQGRDLHVEQGQVDVLPCPGPELMYQRRLDRVRGVEAGQDIGGGDSGLHRFAVGLAGYAHDAAHRLDHEIVSGAPGVGSGLAEPGNRAVHQFRVDRLQAGEIEAVLA